jgi:hypothetical protein
LLIHYIHLVCFLLPVSLLSGSKIPPSPPAGSPTGRAVHGLRVPSQRHKGLVGIIHSQLICPLRFGITIPREKPSGNQLLSMPQPGFQWPKAWTQRQSDSKRQYFTSNVTAVKQNLARFF